MNGGDLLRQLLQLAHATLEHRLAECPPDLLFVMPPGAAVCSIAAIYAHAVLVEDIYVQRELCGAIPLCEAPEWSSRLGISPRTQLDRTWAAALSYDLPTFRAYADAVYTASDDYLAGVSEAELGRPLEINVPHRDGDTWSQVRREAPLALALADNVPLHIHEHAGEISVLRSLLGADRASPN